jgi:hypothetical protein
VTQRMRGVLLLGGLIAVQGLATVQSVNYLRDFISYPQGSGLMYLSAFVIGGVLGWVTTSVRGLLLLPVVIVLGAAAVFMVVAYSPVWAGNSRHSVAVVNELLRQATLIVVLSLVPLYTSAFIGFFARQVREG